MNEDEQELYLVCLRTGKTPKELIDLLKRTGHLPKKYVGLRFTGPEKPRIRYNPEID